MFSCAFSYFYFPFIGIFSFCFYIYILTLFIHIFGNYFFNFFLKYITFNIGSIFNYFIAFIFFVIFYYFIDYFLHIFYVFNYYLFSIPVFSYTVTLDIRKTNNIILTDDNKDINEKNIDLNRVYPISHSDKFIRIHFSISSNQVQFFNFWLFLHKKFGITFGIMNLLISSHLYDAELINCNFSNFSSDSSNTNNSLLLIKKYIYISKCNDCSLERDWFNTNILFPIVINYCNFIVHKYYNYYIHISNSSYNISLDFFNFFLGDLSEFMFSSFKLNVYNYSHFVNNYKQNNSLSTDEVDREFGNHNTTGIYVSNNLIVSHFLPTSVDLVVSSKFKKFSWNGSYSHLSISDNLFFSTFIIHRVISSSFLSKFDMDFLYFFGSPVQMEVMSLEFLQYKAPICIFFPYYSNPSIEDVLDISICVNNINNGDFSYIGEYLWPLPVVFGFSFILHVFIEFLWTCNNVKFYLFCILCFNKMYPNNYSLLISYMSFVKLQLENICKNYDMSKILVEGDFNSSIALANEINDIFYFPPFVINLYLLFSLFYVNFSDYLKEEGFLLAMWLLLSQIFSLLCRYVKEHTYIFILIDTGGPFLYLEDPDRSKKFHDVMLFNQHEIISNIGTLTFILGLFGYWSEPTNNTTG